MVNIDLLQFRFESWSLEKENDWLKRVYELPMKLRSNVAYSWGVFPPFLGNDKATKLPDY